MTAIAAEFLALHRPGDPLVMPNPWDTGSARMLAHLGFAALATTSGGFALTLGRPDGQVSRDESLAHAADLGVSRISVGSSFAYAACGTLLAAADHLPVSPSREFGEAVGRGVSLAGEALTAPSV